MQVPRLPQRKLCVLWAKYVPSVASAKLCVRSELWTDLAFIIHSTNADALCTQGIVSDESTVNGKCEPGVIENSLTHPASWLGSTALCSISTVPQGAVGLPRCANCRCPTSPRAPGCVALEFKVGFVSDVRGFRAAVKLRS